MIALRDILIFAGLMALAAAVIAALFPAREGPSPVPACSDCAFKLTGGYWIRQYGNYASLYLGTREAARYGWAYRADGRPLGVGETVGCDPMYVHVLDGIAYISCNDNNSTFGRRVLSTIAEGVALSSAEGVNISANSSKPGCTYTVSVPFNESTTVELEVYDENGRLVYSASGAPPAAFTFRVPVAGTYRMHVYAPPLLDEWHTLYAGININASKAAVFTSNNTQDLRPSVTLKIFNLTDYWKRGYTSVTVYVNPRKDSFTLSAPAGAFADYLLAWEDCSTCRWTYNNLYVDEVWRLTFTPSGPVFTSIRWWWRWGHDVYADGKLIPWYINKYTSSDPTITVKFVSLFDSTANAGATFTKVCSWS